MDRRVAPAMNKHRRRLLKGPSRNCVARRRTSRALGRDYENSRDRRILQQHCIITSHVPRTTRRVALLTTPRSLGHRKKSTARERQTVLGEAVNLICGCACPLCWRRSNVIIHERRTILCWMWHNQGLTLSTLILLVIISLVHYRVSFSRMIILLPLPLCLRLTLSFVFGCSNKSIFKTNDV